MSKEHYGGRRALRPKVQAARRAEEGRVRGGLQGVEEQERRRGRGRGTCKGE